jgi:hypothetical protein
MRQTFLIVALIAAGSALDLAAAGLGANEPPVPPYSPASSGWVLADLNGDQSIDLATARTGSHDANGYTQEVRITLGAFRQTSFHFLSLSATVELSSLDVDGDQDGDLVVFEPLSSQPIGVWLNDGSGSFHEGRLADFRKLWSEQPGSAWRVSSQPLASFAISEERTQSVAPPAEITAPEPILAGLTRQNERVRQDARRSDIRPRAPPRNS